MITSTAVTPWDEHPSALKDIEVSRLQFKPNRKNLRHGF